MKSYMEWAFEFMYVTGRHLYLTILLFGAWYYLCVKTLVFSLLALHVIEMPRLIPAMTPIWISYKNALKNRGL